MEPLYSSSSLESVDPIYLGFTELAYTPSSLHHSTGATGDHFSNASKSPILDSVDRTVVVCFLRTYLGVVKSRRMSVHDNIDISMSLF